MQEKLKKPVEVPEEQKYTIGRHLLENFKIDAKREAVRGTAGPYTVLVNAEQEVTVFGRNEEKNRDWFAEYKVDRFWITVYGREQTKEKWTFPIYFDGKHAQFSHLNLLDNELFEKEAGRKVKGGYIGMDDVRKALSLHEEGRLHLSDGDKSLGRIRLEHLKDLARYGAEIEEAAGLFDQAQRLKTHPEVMRLAREKGLLEENPVMTEERAAVLTAMDSIAKKGESASALKIIEWLERQRGVEPGPSEPEDIMKMTEILYEIQRAGYVQMTRKGLEPTDFGRKELEEYSKKKFSYVK